MPNGQDEDVTHRFLYDVNSTQTRDDLLDEGYEMGELRNAEQEGIIMFQAGEVHLTREGRERLNGYDDNGSNDSEYQNSDTRKKLEDASEGWEDHRKALDGGTEAEPAKSQTSRERHMEELYGETEGPEEVYSSKSTDYGNLCAGDNYEDENDLLQMQIRKIVKAKGHMSRDKLRSELGREDHNFKKNLAYMAHKGEITVREEGVVWNPTDEILGFSSFGN